MPVQWRKPAPARVGPQFVTCPPNRIVQPLCSPKDYAVLRLHWVGERNSSFPCMGPDCVHCRESSPFQHAYAPGWVYLPRDGRWVQGILCLGDASSTLSTMDFADCPIVMGKDKERGPRGRTIFYGNATDPKLPPPPTGKFFDVRPFLLRRWGLFDEAALLECQFHAPTLEFPAQEERSA